MDKTTKERALSSAKRVSLYHSVFGGPAGEKVLYDLMLHHGMLSPHPKDVNEMIMREGERRVILRILTFLKTSPQKLIERIEQNAQDNE